MMKKRKRKDLNAAPAAKTTAAAAAAAVKVGCHSSLFNPAGLASINGTNHKSCPLQPLHHESEYVKVKSFFKV